MPQPIITGVRRQDFAPHQQDMQSFDKTTSVGSCIRLRSSVDFQDAENHAQSYLPTRFATMACAFSSSFPMRDQVETALQYVSPKQELPQSKRGIVKKRKELGYMEISSPAKLDRLGHVPSVDLTSKTNGLLGLAVSSPTSKTVTEPTSDPITLEEHILLCGVRLGTPFAKLFHTFLAHSAHKRFSCKEANTVFGRENCIQPSVPLSQRYLESTPTLPIPRPPSQTEKKTNINTFSLLSPSNIRRGLCSSLSCTSDSQPNASNLLPRSFPFDDGSARLNFDALSLDYFRAKDAQRNSTLVSHHPNTTTSVVANSGGTRYASLPPVFESSEAPSPFLGDAFQGSITSKASLVSLPGAPKAVLEKINPPPFGLSMECTKAVSSGPTTSLSGSVCNVSHQDDVRTFSNNTFNTHTLNNAEIKDRNNAPSNLGHLLETTSSARELPNKDFKLSLGHKEDNDKENSPVNKEMNHTNSFNSDSFIAFRNDNLQRRQRGCRNDHVIVLSLGPIPSIPNRHFR